MKRRYYNIFKEDDRAVIMAFDDGVLGDSNLDIPYIIKEARKGGIDAILTTYGIAKYYKKEIGNLGLILRMDNGGSVLDAKGGAPGMGWTIEQAVKLGCDGVMSMGFPGTEYDFEYGNLLGELAGLCDEWGLVYAAEMLPCGFSENPADHSIANAKIACRFASEKGVDFIKAQFMGEGLQYKEVVDNAFAPVLILGGGEKSDKEVLQMTKDAMDCGCKGCVFGRNFFNSTHTAKIVRAVVAIVHEGASVDEAMKYLD